MKMTTLKSVAIAVGLASSAFGQATSGIVGYTTDTLKTGVNVVGATLQNKAEAAGSFDSIVGSGTFADGDTTLSLIGANFGLTSPDPVTGLPVYTVEITSGDYDGSVLLVESFTADSVTVAQNLTVATTPLTAPASFVIRESLTVSDIFGAANEVGLNPSADGTTNNADEILVPDGNGNFITVIYIDGSGYFTTTFGNGDLPFVYTDSIVVIRKSGPDVPVVISGAVKETQTIVPLLNSAASYISVVNPNVAAGGANKTVSELGLESSITSLSDFNDFGDTTKYDRILVPDGNGGFTEVIYSTVTGSEGWFLSNFSGSGDVPVGEDGLVVLPALGASSLVIPAPTIGSQL